MQMLIIWPKKTLLLELLNTLEQNMEKVCVNSLVFCKNKRGKPY
jgi:hypothetical protein